MTNQEINQFLEFIYKKTEEVKNDPEKAKAFILSLNLPQRFVKRPNKAHKQG